MSNPKGRAWQTVLNSYFFFIILLVVDLFVQTFMFDRTVVGESILGYVGCLLVTGISIYVKRRSFSQVGLVLSKKKISKGLLFGIILSVSAVAIPTFIQFFFYTVHEQSKVSLTFITPNFQYVALGSPLSSVSIILIYAAAVFISSFAKELFFRGYILNIAQKKYPFKDANILQAFLYIFPSILKALRNFVFASVFGIVFSVKALIISIIFYAIHDFISGYKWGMMRKASGAIWVSFFEHFLYSFLCNCIYITGHNLTLLYSLMNLLFMQLISCAIVFVYYKIKIKKVKSKKLKIEIAKTERKLAYAKMQNPEPTEAISEEATNSATENEVPQVQSSSSNEQMSTGDFKHQYNKEHHHSHHHDSLNSHNSSGSKLEDFSHSNIKERTDKFAGLDLNGKHHKHHHKHHSSSSSKKVSKSKSKSDTEIISLESDNILNLSDKSINDFLSDYSDELNKTINKKSHHRHHHHSKTEAVNEVTELSTSKDIASLSKEKKDEMISKIGTHSKKSTSSAHKHHHHHSGNKANSGTMSLKDIDIDEFYAEYAKEQIKKSEEKKEQLEKKVNDLKEKAKNE